MSDNNNICPTSIGGQAVIEGVMMKGPEDIAIAIRKSSGDILLHKQPLKSAARRNRLFKLPVFRGMFALIDTMVLGVRALTFSAEQMEFAEEEGTSGFDKFVEKIFGDKAEEATIYFSVFLSLVFTVLLFIILPTFLIRFLKFSVQSTIVMNLMEGVIRITVFIIYLLAVSKIKDIQRVFEYHGAEHKVIHCYEHRQELTVENAARFTTLHPRCGTSFLLIVLVVSIIVFSFLGWPNLLVRVVSRLLLLPVVGGISYEIIKWAGRSNSLASRIVRKPGLFLQKLTTREPDEGQLEVAIEALKGVLVEQEGADAW
ncbi:MAG: hypothetical protein HPY66_1579 [Firmicutes bacterium]|nr:hypothetical protein [Bacillota bacterium]